MIFIRIVQFENRPPKRAANSRQALVWRALFIHPRVEHSWVFTSATLSTSSLVEELLQESIIKKESLIR